MYKSHPCGLFVRACLIAFAIIASNSRAFALDQWATSVIDFSSQYGAVGWSAQQALGSPNTFSYGDSSTAWSPAPMNGTTEWITVGYDVPVFAHGAKIREVWGNGFVKMIEVMDETGVFHTVWASADKTPTGAATNFGVSWTQTNYPVRGLRITVNTSKNLTTREQIDAIQLIGEPAHGPVEEWSHAVINYSSQYSSNFWSAAQAVGPPDTANYGDFTTAWSPAKQNGSLEYLTMAFPQPLYSTGVTIRETYGNGAVYQIDAVDMNNVLHTVWSGTDPSLPGAPANFTVSWPETPYLTKGVRIYVNTSHNLTTWEQIDAVKLYGVTSTFADLILAPSNTIGGKVVTGKVYLFKPAPLGGLTIGLASSNATLAPVPASVTIPEGATQAAFTIQTTGVSATTVVTITASLTTGDTQTAKLTLTPANISSVALSPADQIGGKVVTGKVTLSGFAPPGGAVVDLNNTNLAASLPGGLTVTVPEGANTATFTINTTPVVSVTTGNISATYRSITKTAVLDVLPPSLLKITISPTSMKGGLSCVATVFLNGISPTSYTVDVSTSHPALAWPVDANGSPISTVTIPAGTDRISFKVQSAAVTVSTVVNVNAVMGGITKFVKLTLKP